MLRLITLMAKYTTNTVMKIHIKLKNNNLAMISIDNLQEKHFLNANLIVT